MKIISQKNLAVLFFIYACSLLLFYYVGFASDYSDSDSASELLLAKELASENKFMSTNWYYSTELRIINTQIISMLLFKITDNWKVVKIFTSIILCTLLCFSYQFLLRTLNINNNAIFFLTMSLLLLPLSKIFFDFFHGNNYYFPHVIFSYIYIGLFFILCDFKQKNHSFFFYLVSYLFVSFFAGLAGLRYLLTFQIPVFLTTLLFPPFGQEDLKKSLKAFIKKIINQNIFKYSFIGLVLGGIGYIINGRVLSKLFSFANYNTTSFIQIGSRTFGDILDAFFQMLGYRYKEVSLFSKISVVNYNAIFFIIGTYFITYRLLKLRNKLSQYEKILVYSCFMSFFVITIAFLITNISISSRYFIPSFFLIIPCIAVFFKYEGNKLFKELVLFIVLTSFILGSASVFVWIQYRKIDLQSKIDITHFLLENNYTFGYSVAGANLFMELSNGHIEVASLSKNFNTTKWLNTKHVYQSNYKESEKIFLILVKEDFIDRYQNSAIQAGELIFENKDYSVLSYLSNR
ncbi:MAG: hypothetical protein ACRC4W_00815, partial [Treponemataceae bacterium]